MHSSLKFVLVNRYIAQITQCYSVSHSYKKGSASVDIFPSYRNLYTIALSKALAKHTLDANMLYSAI